MTSQPTRPRWSLVSVLACVVLVASLSLVGVAVAGQGGAAPPRAQGDPVAEALARSLLARADAQGDGSGDGSETLRGGGGRAAGMVIDRAASGADPAATAQPGAAVPDRPVALRALVVAVDGDDLALPSWVSTLDRIGAAYDVVHAAQDALTWDLLVGDDGVGRYNAVLLTTTSLLRQTGDGEWVSELDADEWATLQRYESTYAVRRATLFGSYGDWPEETCVRPVSEGAVDEAGVPAMLTDRGALVFDFLDPAVELTIRDSWVYRNELVPDCGAEPVIVSGDDVLGTVQVTSDGREQLALSFSSNEHLLHSHLLTYGLFRWATRGLHLGERRHVLKLDVDDFFNASELMLEDLTPDPAGIRLTGDDALNLRTQQQALREAHPLAQAFRLTLAYNGVGVDTSTAADCSGGGEDALVAASLCVKDHLEWINHTFSHPKMNTTDLQTSIDEIARNREVSSALGLRAPESILKTGEYSGLGVYHDAGEDSVDPPTDHGLMATNPALIEAAARTGTWYLHGNMSFDSHRPECFNCNIPHPMDERVKVVPDWPTNIAYFSATPAQQTAFYNSVYGPEGPFATWPADQTYEQIIDHESDAALNRIAMGSIYSNTMHIPNLHDYGGGRTLAFDWVRAVVSKYESLFSVPLLSPSWLELAEATDVRTAHFAVKDDVQAVWYPSERVVLLTSPLDGTVQVTGVLGPSRQAYAGSPISVVALEVGVTSSVPARPLP